MSTKYTEIFAALAGPFIHGEVRERKHDHVPYITARSVMNRLDEVMGPENWRVRYEKWSDNGVVCHLTLIMPDGEEVVKTDIGAYTTMADKSDKADAGDDDKGGFSDALKRVGVLVGIGRYLYDVGVPDFARHLFNEPTPTPRDEAPRRSPQQGQEAPRQEQRPAHQPAQGQNYGPPKTGKSLFAWIKDQETKHQISLLGYMNSFGKLQEFPGRMVEWDAEQVALAYQEGLRKLETAKGAA